MHSLQIFNSTIGKQHSSLIYPKPRTVHFELLVFALLLAIMNIFPGFWREQLMFLPAAVVSGEWWRVLTHPFVHVSLYHLLLDGSAFLMLYAELSHWRTRERLLAVTASGAGSLLAALTVPAIWVIGFCGLSGVAHGLMAIAAIEMIRSDDLSRRRAGWCALLMVIGKALVEAVTGNVVLAFLHFGLMGTPIAVCHAGGILGGLIFVLFRKRFSHPQKSLLDPFRS